MAATMAAKPAATNPAVDTHNKVADYQSPLIKKPNGGLFGGIKAWLANGKTLQNLAKKFATNAGAAQTNTVSYKSAILKGAGAGALVGGTIGLCFTASVAGADGGLFAFTGTWKGALIGGAAGFITTFFSNRQQRVKDLANYLASDAIKNQLIAENTENQNTTILNRIAAFESQSSASAAFADLNSAELAIIERLLPKNNEDKKAA